MSKKLLLILIIFSSTLFTFSVDARDFIDKGHFIIDLKLRIEWLKCSAGQIWKDEECKEEPQPLNMEEANEALNILNRQLEGKWRLPDKKELESIVCKECVGAKIDSKIFPKTPAGSFWTSQRNWWSPKFYWSVNFFTGHTYGRFVPEKKLYVRFVRDR